MPTPSVLHPDYTAPVRANDPATSQAAADSVNVRASWLDVWEALLRRGACIAQDLEIDLQFKQSPQRVRTALSELETEGAVEYHEGDERLTRSGRAARVVHVVPDNKRAVELTRAMEARKWTL